VNLHVEAADRLLGRFDFVPQARLDDVMVSFAARGGGVGPHVDSYDVFLLQASGRRHWRVWGSNKKALEYLAETGDLLYLPPGWRHDGVALEPCFTYSIGFRAPRGAELGAAFLDWLHERGLPDAAYRDPRLEPTSRPAQIRRAPCAGGACGSGLRLASSGLRTAEGGDMSETVYERFETNADFQAAVDRLLEQPGRELRIFDPDGSGLRLNDPLRIARLERFLMSSRTRRIYLVLHNTDPLTRQCPRMMSLLGRYSHAMQLNPTQEEIRELQDAFLVLDAL